MRVVVQRVPYFYRRLAHERGFLEPKKVALDLILDKEIYILDIANMATIEEYDVW